MRQPLIGRRFGTRDSEKGTYELLTEIGKPTPMHEGRDPLIANGYLIECETPNLA